jgi:cation diffusion facilitator CzcD-associated flavoprotein CzcO
VSASVIDVAIVGPGPYGLSVAAHLNKYRVPYRIFGTPMLSWQRMMPKGMHLKSEGFASDLYDPDDSFLLKHYCAETGQAYADVGVPVPLETFSAYGLEFQRRMVPNLERVDIQAIKRTPGGFELTTAAGETVPARRVVVASGITHFGHVPAPLTDLPPELVSHSSAHGDLSGFKGKRVVVVGAGSSAVDLAALLNEAGASVELVARRKQLAFHSPPRTRTLLERITDPRSVLGTGWRSYLATEAPDVFYSMPIDFRLRVVRTHLGPSTGWFVRDKVEGRFPVHLGVTVQKAEARGNEVHLDVGANGDARHIVADHVVSGTGYRMSLRRLKFLGDELRGQIREVEDTPVLTRSFESSVPGLYFVGTIAANQFGPLLRFVCGAKFTARRISKRLADTKA